MLRRLLTMLATTTSAKYTQRALDSTKRFETCFALMRASRSGNLKTKRKASRYAAFVAGKDERARVFLLPGYNNSMTILKPLLTCWLVEAIFIGYKSMI